nr:carboxymuconolactone decarboxylase family protein [Glycomyces sp. L485]
MLDLIHAVRYEASVSRASRELLICRLAQIEGSAYELAHHLPMAIAAGVSGEQLDRLAEWRSADCFGDAERAVLQYAEHLGTGAAFQSDLLAAHFDPVQQTELTVAGATYIALARILRALDVRVDEGLS